jgi:hypothetical protein
MRGCKFLRLMPHKVTLRSYSYFLHFLHLIFGEKWFLQLCPELPSFVKKPQGILGVNTSFEIHLVYVQLLGVGNWIFYQFEDKSLPFDFIPNSGLIYCASNLQKTICGE